MIRVGVIGYDIGPQHLRNFHGQENTRVEMLCDKNMDALARAKRSLSFDRITTDPCAILKSPNVDAIAVIYARVDSLRSLKHSLRAWETCIRGKNRSPPLPRRRQNSSNWPRVET